MQSAPISLTLRLVQHKIQGCTRNQESMHKIIFKYFIHLVFERDSTSWGRVRGRGRLSSRLYAECGA